MKGKHILIGSIALIALGVGTYVVVRVAGKGSKKKGDEAKELLKKIDEAAD